MKRHLRDLLIAGLILSIFSTALYPQALNPVDRAHATREGAAASIFRAFAANQVVFRKHRQDPGRTVGGTPNSVGVWPAVSQSG